MTCLPQTEGLKARQIIARGNAPGNRTRRARALKGRNSVPSGHVDRRICAALSGLDLFYDMKPRALPWAIIFRPFRAGEGMVSA